MEASSAGLADARNATRASAKGWSAAELLDHLERLTRPLVRAVPGDRSSPLVEASWDQALGG